MTKARVSLTHLGEEWRIQQLAERLCNFSKKYSSYEETGFKHTFNKELGKFNIMNDNIVVKNLRTPYGEVPFVQIQLSTMSLFMGNSQFSYSIVVADLDNPSDIHIIYTRDKKKSYDAFPEPLKELVENYVRILNCTVRELM